MTTPAIRCLKQQKNPEIHYLTKKAFVPILASNPYIDKIISFEKTNKSLVKDLKEEKYDFVVDLHNNLRSSKIRFQLRRPSSKLYKLSIHKEVLIHAGINNLPNLHVAHRAIDTLQEFSINDDEQGMEFFIDDQTVNKAENFKDSFITLALATTHYTKNIPEETLHFIVENAPDQVVLLGGPKEKELGERIEKAFPSQCINMAGKASIQESALLIQKSKYFVGGDTGMLHIACALKIPTISIWGATIPEFGVYPYYGKNDIPHFIHEVHLKCRPCSKHGSSKCPKKHFNCMQLQNLEKIASHLKELSN